MNEKMKVVCGMLVVGMLVLGGYVLPLKAFYLSVLYYGFVSWQALLFGFVSILSITTLSNLLKEMWEKA